MAVQSFALAVGEDEKMGRGEIEIILCHFDAERSGHATDVNQKRSSFQVKATATES
jgi:hypothetical protein